MTHYLNRKLKYRIQLAFCVPLAIGVVVAGVFGVRWLTGLGRLESFAVPPGFHQVAHERQCEGASGSYCVNIWVLTGDDASFEEATALVAESLRTAGWSAHSFDGGLSATKGSFERCLNYRNLADMTDPWDQPDRQRFNHELDKHRTVIFVRSGCG